MIGLDWLGNFHGFLLVDKPEGITSQDVITRIQRAILARAESIGAERPRRKRDLPSMGHGGTLDPFATGLLVVAVGDGVKLTRYLLGSDKTYEAEIEFGARTASGDRTNEVVETTERLPESAAELSAAASTFLDGPYLQVPPMYSAKKIDGVPLYELARKGIEVERAAIDCRVKSLEVLGTTEDPRIAAARIRTKVGSGTFIRTLAEDLAERSGSLGHLTSLRRLDSGPLRVEDSVPLSDLERSIADGRDASTLSGFRPFHRALSGILPRLEIDETLARRVFSGETKALAALRLEDADGPRSEGRRAVALYSRNRLVAVVREADPSTTSPRSIVRAFPLRFDDPID